MRADRDSESDGEQYGASDEITNGLHRITNEALR